MNLFKYFEVFGHVKCFSRKKGFFSPEYTKFKCEICLKPVQNYWQYTCSKECWKIYKKNKDNELKKFNKHQLIQYMQEKYPLKIH